MLGESVRNLIGVLPGSFVLLDATTGLIVAASAATTTLLGRPVAGTNLFDHVAADSDRTRAYLEVCARTASTLPGRVTLHGPDGVPLRCRCDGGRVPSDAAERLVLLHVRRHSEATDRFVLLNRKIEELNAEVHRRRTAQAEVAEKAAVLEDVAVELEQTIEQLQQQQEDANAARRQAEQANRAKSEFLAVMSHELRTPLNVILGNVDLLDAETRGPLEEGQREQLTAVRRSARHLLGLIEQILDFSRLGAGAMGATIEDVDAAAAVRETADLMQPLAERRGLRLIVRVPDGAPTFPSDRGKLDQILLNLMSNAIKFTEHGEVRVVLDITAAGLRLAVSDTGPGIAPVDHERVFQPFTQLDATRTRRAGGTGMGLSVSRELAILLGGTIELESEPGVGSRFTLCLPARALAASAD